MGFELEHGTAVLNGRGRLEVSAPPVAGAYAQDRMGGTPMRCWFTIARS
jgi:hypothetical protein